VEEENIFFKLSNYQQQLEQLIESDTLKILPVERKNEILGFVRRGLQDISISRDAARSEGWGVPFPGTTDQVVYVWIDALANYLVAPEWWSDETRKIHLLGKNVWKFHAIYWPALLLSGGLPLPDELIVHGFVTIDGNKISKSAGPTVDPVDLIRRYGADPVRFYLLHEIPSFTDGDFSEARLEKSYTDSLANGLGNLASRLLTLAERSGLERIAVEPKTVPEAAAAAIEEARYGNYLEVFWEQIRGLNREIDQNKPWEWLKAGEWERTRASCAGWLERLYQIAWWLEPAIPETSARLVGLLSVVPLRKGKVLFPRLGGG
jgi:methionyl-tRNA synthetase